MGLYKTLHQISHCIRIGNNAQAGALPRINTAPRTTTHGSKIPIKLYYLLSFGSFPSSTAILYTICFAQHDFTVVSLSLLHHFVEANDISPPLKGN